MITGKLKSEVDALWDAFWAGGIANPLTVIEQISYLLFVRLLDITETRKESLASRTKKEPQGLVFSKAQQHLRWSRLKHETSPEKLLSRVRDEVFPLLRTLGERDNGIGKFGHYLEQAQCLIPTPNLMVRAVALIDKLPLERGDTKGDLYEYMLGKLSTAGIAGQFRTPRHIIRTMVEMVDPKPDWKVVDPACGTAGFLVGVLEYLQRIYSSQSGTHPAIEDDGTPIFDAHGRPIMTYDGDLLTADHRKKIQEDLLTGFDFDHTMVRIGIMNMLLHGVDTPSLHLQDALAESFAKAFPKQASEAFDLVLANPPFTGAVDDSAIDKSLGAVVKTKKTELLFLALMLRLLKTGGRCAVIVPEGVLFSSSKAHRAIRSVIIEENGLDAVISLPAGVFKPYAGVQTSILIFTKGSKTKETWFARVEADGFSLDDKREPLKENDLGDLLERWKKRSPKRDTNRAERYFFVSKDEMEAAEFDLSFSRYHEIKHVDQAYNRPELILEEWAKLNCAIGVGIADLKKAPQ